MSCIAVRLTNRCRGFQHQLLNSDYSKVGAFGVVDCAVAGVCYLLFSAYINYSQSSCHVMPLLLFGIGVEVAFSLTGVERAAD